RSEVSKMLFFPYQKYPDNWLYQVVDSSNSPLQMESFSLLKLSPHTSYQGELKGEEAVFVLLQGKVKMEVEGKTLGEIAQRKSIFEDKASAFYLPPGVYYQIEAEEDSELILVRAKAEKGGSPAFFPPEIVKVKTTGKGTFEREVHTIVGEDFPAEKLIVGETFNKPGLWSSYPPHRHEKNRPPEEYFLEEIYHYRVEPEKGFGIQVLYTEDKELEKAYLVENGDTFVIPRGYHPVVAAPGYRLYYFWSLAGEVRILNPYDDPHHSWTKNL
ncbi:MAG TPA: 5-deoxy-glucuronate isomerase, partial [Candidatus Atribacteria bacterium]|nr:5-deoxy-glucuronate isomerase [Candidatus Atribacteria bacterium]HQD33547.1 5-deoxy-glucuronate isomerase [Candidatus Atribacteria bacterium]